ncbi:MAG: hypothetical protein MJE12_18915 [Alphaproteobacteria bacterium]|nr:hypothetical protein [Alphaproteobacteria bacterium]
MRRGFVILVGAMVLAGCAATEMPLGDKGDAHLRNHNVYMVKEAPPSFGAITASKGMFAALGAVAAHSAGSEMVRENGIEDPAIIVEQRIVRHIHAKFGAKGIGRVLDYTEKDKPSDGEWNAVAGPNSVIVDVETRGWNFWYFPATWTRYRVGYSAVLRLIDGETGQVLSQYTCGISAPDSADAAPTYDEMMADRAALLKKMLAERADQCADQMVSKVL